MIRMFARWLRDPRLAGIDVDSTELLAVHGRILREKPMMHGVFSEFYDLCTQLDERLFRGEGARVELGAGVSFFKERHPGIVATDIKPGLDLVVDATSMPFPDRSVRAFYAINCFHHLPSPDRFFQELRRTLVPGGGCVLIEPYYGLLGRALYPWLFPTETFDRSQAQWESSPGMGVMKGANQALSYVVFVRDRAKFDARYPDLEIAHTAPIGNYPRYLLSGGLNFKQLAPNWAIGTLQRLEQLASPLARSLALHHVVVLRMRGDQRRP